MQTIARKNTKSSNKSPEITRFINFLDDQQLNCSQLSDYIDIPERTITNFVWENRPLGAQLLRKVLAIYGVSIDWLITGRGAMYLPAKTSESESESESERLSRHFRADTDNRLIALKENVDNSSLDDVYLIFAALIEQSLLEAGAEPGMDYGYLDLYQLAQPHVLDEAKKTALKVQVFSKNSAMDADD